MDKVDLSEAYQAYIPLGPYSYITQDQQQSDKR